MPQDSRPGFPIVGLGASAGGLEAFTQLLRHLPVDTGMAFVLVQHLDPEHESALVQLLSRTTMMPVREAADRLRVAPNHVYVIPRDKLMSIAGGTLQLQPRTRSRGPARAIDFFFETLAQDQRERAIGVILSGTATDGTLGMEAIKGEGGITIAQDASAKYDSMPRSAVAAGCVDFELSPEKIARELARIAAHPFVAVRAAGSERRAAKAGDAAAAHQEDDLALPSGGQVAKPRRAAGSIPAATTAPDRDEPASYDESGLKKILLLVRNHSSVDFSLYKSATIQRRVARRMVLGRHHTHAAYAGFLRGNARELDALFSDLLISVTTFFRNPEAFDLLRRKVFPKLLAQRSEIPVRIWVLGCSTGQEAYSIAMAFAESAENAPRARKLQIFATDLNDALLDKARAGLYAKSLAQDLSPERLRRFFTEEEGGYRATKELRQSVVFAKQNVLADPPFSRMDLISCRNLLIYFEQGWQKRIVPMFHYALNPEGVLFLGASESVAGFAELFEPLDKKHKLFGRRLAPTPRLNLPSSHREQRSPRTAEPRRALVPPDTTRTELNAQREADRLTVSQFAPPAVLVNAAFQVLQFRGPTSAYLEPPNGNASFDVLKMAREGLMLPLRAALNKAKKEGKPVHKEHVPMRDNGRPRLVTLQVTPLKNLKELCFLVMFEEEGKGARAVARPQPDERVATRPAGKREESRRIHALTTELAETRDYVQAIQEQNEAASEELQASNEEVTSANEELQSINEELETSKEELESANEELTTVNEEMATRNGELNRLNADLNNLHVSINTAILVVGRDLTLRRFTPLAEKAFNLLGSDLGRPLSGIRHNLDFSFPSEERIGGAPGNGKPPSTLEDLVREVIDTVSLRVREMRDRDGRWYSLRVRPYLTLDQKIDGAVLVLVDIDALKRSEEDAKSARDYAEATLRTTHTPLIVLRANLRVNTANTAFYKTFRTTPSETEGRLLWELGNGQWKIPRLRDLLEDILPGKTFFEELEIAHDVPGLGARTMLLNASRLDSATGTPEMILLAIEDVSERRRLDDSVRRNEARFRALTVASAQIVWTTNPAGQVEEDSPSWRDFTGQTLEQWRGWGWLDAVHPEDRDRTKKFWEESVTRPHIVTIEYRVRRADGVHRWMGVRVVPVFNADGTLREWIGTNADITEQKEAADRIQISELRYRRLFEEARDGVLLVDPVTRRITDANPFITTLLGYTREELLGRELWEIGLLKDEAESQAAFRQLQEQGSIRYEDLPLQSKAGELREVEFVSNLYGEGGREVIQCNIRDITARKQADTALRESEERYRNLFNSIDAGFCVIEMLFDPDGQPSDYRFLEVNPAFEKETGLRGAGGKRMRELVPDHEAYWFEVYGRVARTGQPVRFEHEAKAMRRWFEVYAFRLSVSDSRRVALLFKDTTESRRSALELERLRDEAVAASRAKDEFLAALSHELRTPLNPILLLASEAADNSDLPENVRADFEMIRKNINLEARLIDDLLDLTRISRGKLKIERQPCDAHSILRDALAVVKSDLVDKRIRLSLELTADRARVMGDPVRLQQIFWNVLRNAMHFTPIEGAIAVRTKVNPAGDAWVATIADTGIGIAAGDLARIFERFVQADVALDKPRSSGGLGLGLAISRTLVDMHSGSIMASSPGRGGGSTFEIKLPLLEEPSGNISAMPPASSAVPPVAPVVAPPLRRTTTEPKRRVLIVEDHAPTRTTLQRLLARRNFEVLTASSVAEALAQAGRHGIDLVISDIGLPDADGYSLMVQLRAMHPAVAGIALSGYGAESDLAQSRAAGFSEHLTKPVGIESLERALRKVVDGRPGSP